MDQAQHSPQGLPDIELRASYASRIKVHRAGKAIHFVATEAAPDGYRTDDPIIAARAVIQSRSQEIDVGGAEAIPGLFPDGILTDAYGLFGGEPAAATIETASIIVAAGIGPVAVIISIAIVGPTSVVGTISIVGSIAIVKASGRRRKIVTSAPRDVKSIAFGAIIRIFDSHHGGSAVPWIPDEILPASSIDATEAEVCRIRRHDSGALKPSPLWRLSREIAERAGASSDLDFSRSVDHHLNGALASVRTASAPHDGAALSGLSIHTHGGCGQSHHPQESIVHFSPPQ
jgi:hypothetical protein